MLAGLTRLELATSGVTGRRSNQLSYNPASTLIAKLRLLLLVGETGFEPVTPCL
jgi:cytochrome b